MLKGKAVITYSYMDMKRYEEIDHTADLAARIYGKDLAQLFKNAAFCVFDLTGDSSSECDEGTFIIELEDEDTELLLIKWLNELLFLSFEKKMLFSDIDILYLDGKKIKAQVKGNSYARREKILKKEIKAATYHDVQIKKTPDGYEVIVVFDV